MHSKVLRLDKIFSFLRLFQAGSINVVVIAINRHRAGSLVAIACAIADDVLLFHYLVFSPDKTNQS